MGIQDLPSSDRPRERLMQAGGGALSDAELIAALLGTGTRGSCALDTAQALLGAFGGLAALARAEPAELATQRGLGPAKACALAAALELGRRALSRRPERALIRASVDAYDYCRPRLQHLRFEAFHVLCLDAKHRVLRDARIAEGGLTSCLLLPREVFAPALREGATSVIFVHNHPSGDPDPSAEDLALTRRLKSAGEMLGIKVLDHVIVGEERYVSLADNRAGGIF